MKRNPESDLDNSTVDRKQVEDSKFFCCTDFRKTMAERIVDIVKGLLICLALVLYHWIVAILKAVLPTSLQAKDVSGETVLVTGAGEVTFSVENNRDKNRVI